MVHDNVVIEGLAKSGRSKALNGMLDKLKEETDCNCVVLTENSSKLSEKGVTVLNVNRLKDTAYDYVRNMVIMQRIAKLNGSESCKKKLTVLIDVNKCKAEIRAILDLVVKTEGINYIVTAYSADNGFPEVKHTIHTTLGES